MYLVFPPAYHKLAEIVHKKAQQKHGYEPSEITTGLPDSVSLDRLTVSISELGGLTSAKDRWDVLFAMTKGAVFVHYKGINEAHFFTPDENTSMDDQVNKIIVAGKYAEGRAKYVGEHTLKAKYVGPSYADPLAIIICRFSRNKEGFEYDYDPVIPKVLESLPKDLWPKVAIGTGHQTGTVNKVLDIFPDTAIVTFDKRSIVKLQSYQHTVLVPPKEVDPELGFQIDRQARLKDVERDD